MLPFWTSVFGLVGHLLPQGESDGACVYNGYRKVATLDECLTLAMQFDKPACPISNLGMSTSISTQPGGCLLLYTSFYPDGCAGYNNPPAYDGTQDDITQQICTLQSTDFHESCPALSSWVGATLGTPASQRCMTSGTSYGYEPFERGPLEVGYKRHCDDTQHTFIFAKSHQNNPVGYDRWQIRSTNSSKWVVPAATSWDDPIVGDQSTKMYFLSFRDGLDYVNVKTMYEVSAIDNQTFMIQPVVKSSTGEQLCFDQNTAAAGKDIRLERCDVDNLAQQFSVNCMYEKPSSPPSLPPPSLPPSTPPVPTDCTFNRVCTDRADTQDNSNFASKYAKYVYALENGYVGWVAGGGMISFCNTAAMSYSSGLTTCIIQFPPSAPPPQSPPPPPPSPAAPSPTLPPIAPLGSICDETQAANNFVPIEYCRDTIHPLYTAHDPRVDFQEVSSTENNPTAGVCFFFRAPSAATLHGTVFYHHLQTATNLCGATAYSGGYRCYCEIGLPSPPPPSPLLPPPSAPPDPPAPPGVPVNCQWAKLCNDRAQSVPNDFGSKQARYDYAIANGYQGWSVGGGVIAFCIGRSRSNANGYTTCLIEWSPPAAPSPPVAPPSPNPPEMGCHFEILRGKTAVEGCGDSDGLGEEACLNSYKIRNPGQFSLCQYKDNPNIPGTKYCRADTYRFTCSPSTPPPAPPPPTPHHQWFLGSDGLSCTDVCAAIGSECVQSALAYESSDTTFMESLFAGVGITCLGSSTVTHPAAPVYVNNGCYQSANTMDHLCTEPTPIQGGKRVCPCEVDASPPPSLPGATIEPTTDTLPEYVMLHNYGSNLGITHCEEFGMASVLDEEECRVNARTLFGNSAMTLQNLATTATIWPLGCFVRTDTEQIWLKPWTETGIANSNSHSLARLICRKSAPLTIPHCGDASFHHLFMTDINGGTRALRTSPTTVDGVITVSEGRPWLIAQTGDYTQRSRMEFNAKTGGINGGGQIYNLAYAAAPFENSCAAALNLHWRLCRPPCAPAGTPALSSSTRSATTDASRRCRSTRSTTCAARIQPPPWPF